jgi:teichuronic acid biosynthesis glycosyltransferase TuaG
VPSAPDYSNRLVSIVTPAYKAAQVVGSAIESVQAQDYAEWEMLIVDDRSPDDTAAVVEPYCARDPRVKLIRLPENRGAAMARNAALERAAGRYIAFLDSDDYWLPGKLSKQLEFMGVRKAGLSFTSFRRISGDGKQMGHLIGVPSQIDYRGLLKNTAIATSTAIVDRSIAGDIRMKKAFYDDYVLWLGILKRGIVAHGLPLDLMRYRVLGNSISRNKMRSAVQIWRTLRDFEHLSLPHATWCWSHYAWNAVRKYRRF